MTDPSRRIAFAILKAVESEGAFSNILLNRKLQTAEGADAAFVRSTGNCRLRKGRTPPSYAVLCTAC